MVLRSESVSVTAWNRTDNERRSIGRAHDLLRVANTQLVEDNKRLRNALQEQVDTLGAKTADEVDSPRIAKIRALLAALKGKE
jgi:hypothetical protein